MTDEVKSTPLQPNRMQMLMAAGVLLLGLAALIIAFQWQTQTRITVETPAGEPTKVGFEIVQTFKRGLNGNEPHQYLLDKDSGRIWVESKELSAVDLQYIDVWKEVKVEGLTPSRS